MPRPDDAALPPDANTDADRPAPDIALVNARVITPDVLDAPYALDAARPPASAILTRRGKIAWIGDALSPAAAGPERADRFQRIDCRGGCIVPGFIDAHCHILAYAASLIGADCRPTAAPSIAAVVDAIRRRARQVPPGEWIRAYGYSDFHLREKRHPTRWDLDRAAPNNPVRLNHRSGHACVLNSLALQRLGISGATEEPDGATISRRPHDGAIDGLLLDMDDHIDARMPRMPDAELRAGVKLANDRILAAGVTAIHDATPSNSLERWSLMRRLREDGALSPSIVMMPGAKRLHEFADAGMRRGHGDAALTLGHAKAMLTRSGGRLSPSPDELTAMVGAARRLGFPTAIHAVESEAVIAAAGAIAANRAPNMRHRIEHASECPPDALRAATECGAVVVTQPGFIRDSGDRYIAEFGAAARWLYRIGALTAAGAVVAAGSDAPAGEPNPLADMRAAVSRRTLSGAALCPSEAVSPAQALRMHTAAAAYAGGQERVRGSIAVGMRADLALLDSDPLAALAAIRDGAYGANSADYADAPMPSVAMTIIGGRVAWRKHDA